jgi:HEAT repeat protein
MKVATICGPRKLFIWKRSGVLVLAFASAACMLHAAGQTQTAPPKPETAAGDEIEAPAVTISMNSTSEERARDAWRILTDAAGDAKHTQTRLQALAALGLLRSPRSSKMIANAMMEPDLDLRTAAALAAGQTKDRNLTTNLRNLLDDKEPQVAFVAAMTLWKMNDKSGEDILMSVANGDRSTSPTLLHGTRHKIGKDLHDPAMLARLGAMQGAYMLLGPFGYGITAFQFMHQTGGDFARASAIEQLSQERIEPVHRELMVTLADKDAIVRAAALKGLMEYHDNATSMAIYKLFVDSKYPVRLTAAAAYLRTTGTPGPGVAAAVRLPGSAKH